MYSFVTGGYRSGRSNYALRRAAELGHPPWLYVSSGVDTDEAVRKRIERHRRDNEAIWRTLPMPAHPVELLEGGALEGVGAAVIDGIPSWIAERAAALPAGKESELLGEVETLADRLYRAAVPLVVVSGEMGLGGAPPAPEAQRLLMLVTSANQILAARAGSVVLMVSGVPFKAR